MNYRDLLDGHAVKLEDLLDAREQRAAFQKKLQECFHLPLLSFTLNIAGPIKNFSLADRAFSEGIALISYQCKAHSLSIKKVERHPCAVGYECFFVIDAPAVALKKAMSLLEEQSPLGRLFDLDVLDADGQKISRESVGFSPRKCLLCDRSAFACGRSRAHSIEAIQEKTCEILWEYFSAQYAAKTASHAVKALLDEVNATPKPGLVDRLNNGSHRDMSTRHFMESALALQPYFLQACSYGIHHASCEPSSFLKDLRPLGQQAEVWMLEATRGVNTHKGAIFTMGILCAALGFLYGSSLPYSRSALQNVCRQIALPLEHDFEKMAASSPGTHGETMFQKYQVRGARGEALKGFPTLFETALPSLCDSIRRGFSQNDAGILTLLKILASFEDTNIISRSSYETLSKIHLKCAKILKDSIESQDYIGILTQLDQEMIAQNISPGGSADLLAAAYFLWYVEQETT